MCYYACNGYVYEYKKTICKRWRVDNLPSNACGRVTKSFVSKPRRIRKQLQEAEMALKLDNLFSMPIRCVVDGAKLSECIRKAGKSSSYIRFVGYKGRLYIPDIKQPLRFVKMNTTHDVNGFAFSLLGGLLYDFANDIESGCVCVSFNDSDMQFFDTRLIVGPVALINSKYDMAVMALKYDPDLFDLVKAVMDGAGNSS